MQEDPHFSNSKNSEKLTHYGKFVVTHCVKISRFYHVLTIHKYSNNDRKLSVFKTTYRLAK
jgi:hypothetical protein